MKPVSDIINSLAIVAENIDEEAIMQPMLFVDAARYRVAKMRVRAQAETALDQITGELGLTIRARGSDSSERITNDYIKSRVQKHPKFRRLQTELQQAEQKEEFSKLLLEAYRMRRDALRIVAESQAAEGLRQVSGIERKSAERRLSQEARKLYARKHSVDE
jgi:hypothetical protein